METGRPEDAYGQIQYRRLIAWSERLRREADAGIEGVEPRFVHGDLAAIGDLVSPGYGGAICLGNTLPHLTDLNALQRCFCGLASRLVSGAPFLLQSSAPPGSRCAKPSGP